MSHADAHNERYERWHITECLPLRAAQVQVR
jgi:hypothetical protein